MGRIRIRPVAGKILLRVTDEEDKNTLVDAGGILVQKQTTRSGSREAIVEAVHNGYVGDLVPGTRVVLPPHAGTERRINGALYVFIKPEDVQMALD